MPTAILHGPVNSMQRASRHAEHFAWLDRFRERHNRALRVLHIGNTANNAYNNARIQRRFGIDAFVISARYYHVAACPEWEDADLEGDVGDPLYPDWWGVDLKGFVRPRWFAQGPLPLCQAYLSAAVSGAKWRAAALWRGLEAARWARVRRHPLAVAARRAVTAVRRHSRPRTLDAGPGCSAPPSRTHPACAEFDRLFPSRADRLVDADLAPVLTDLASYSALMGHFDIVQAYATAGAYPMMSRLDNWTAYEHGTLREVPFEASGQGRLCALTYRTAPIVFITNVDNLHAAERLGIASERQVCLPHAFDSDKLRTYAKQNTELRPPKGGPIRIFHPARQHWRSHPASMQKGNDRLLRGAAEAAANGVDLRLLMVDWGADVEASRSLARELGIADRIEWVPLLNKKQLWQQYLLSHAVADQFVLSSIAGVSFEAMALGRRVVMAMDGPTHDRFFGQRPPVLDAATDRDIAARLAEIAQDRDDRAALGAAAAEWIDMCHSAERTVALQAAAYRRILSPAPAST